MKWHNPLWFGPQARKNDWKIIRSIKNRKTVANLYLITLAENPSDLLDIISADVLMKKKDSLDQRYLIGIAAGKKEAFELVKTIVDDIYKSTGTLKIREYFS